MNSGAAAPKLYFRVRSKCVFLNHYNISCVGVNNSSALFLELRRVNSNWQPRGLSTINLETLVANPFQAYAPTDCQSGRMSAPRCRKRGKQSRFKIGQANVIGHLSPLMAVEWLHRKLER